MQDRVFPQSQFSHLSWISDVFFSENGHRWSERRTCRPRDLLIKRADQTSLKQSKNGLARVTVRSTLCRWRRSRIWLLLFSTIRWTSTCAWCVVAAPPRTDFCCATVVTTAITSFVWFLPCTMSLKGTGGAPSASLRLVTHTHTCQPQGSWKKKIGRQIFIPEEMLPLVSAYVR